ncbi:MAG: hypothetical protein FWC61_03840 [Proteobacteria bacterium]|nr:hypothetical protein [Pseudomonadota bacterium]
MITISPNWIDVKGIARHVLFKNLVNYSICAMPTHITLAQAQEFLATSKIKEAVFIGHYLGDIAGWLDTQEAIHAGYINQRDYDDDNGAGICKRAVDAARSENYTVKMK